MKKKLFILSIDSLFWEDIAWFDYCPNLQSLYSRSAVVQQLLSTYPAMTYVAHSTIMTGCHQQKHGIYHNEKVEVGAKHPPWHWYRNELGTSTIFDAAKQAGYTCAVINWPVTGGDPSIDYLVPEIWPDDPSGDCRPRFTTVCSPGMETLFDRHSHLLRWKYQPELDSFGVACLGDIMTEHQPDVVALHLSYLDHARHSHGAFGPEARDALIACDRRLGELMEILRSQGLLEQTNFCVMGDHGHLPVKQVFHPNILLARAGLLTTDEHGAVTDWQCYIHSAGLSAHVVLRNPDDPHLRTQVEALLAEWVADETLGCEQIFDKTQAAVYHLQGPFDYVIEGRLGTSFGNNCSGPLLCPTDNSDYKLSVSAHGHLPHKGPQPIFFAAGPAIKAGVTLPRGELVDQAPTYAAILGTPMPWAQGKVMQEILNQSY